MWPPYSRKRLSSHRLGHIPGPMLAALTMHHAAYCDIIKDGGWVEHLEELHKRYGVHRLRHLCKKSSLLIGHPEKQLR